MNKITIETLTISKDDVIEFKGVTIRKAVLENGDFTDLKAFDADENSAKRTYLRSLKKGDVVKASGMNRVRPNGFREFVYYFNADTPSSDQVLSGF